METWVYVFEVKKTDNIIEISSTLENKYFVPQSWEPQISQHIVILGNNFDYNSSYELIAPEELSETLMVPEWNIWSLKVISGFTCFIILLYSTKFISKIKLKGSKFNLPL